MIDEKPVDAFADVTGDHQWIHIDPERAKAESPYGTTIAHGYLTLSMIPTLSKDNFRDLGQSSRRQQSRRRDCRSRRNQGVRCEPWWKHHVGDLGAWRLTSAPALATFRQSVAPNEFP